MGAAEDRRGDLGAFLRFCRERRSPADVGLPSTARRRTPGLRREEVAALAGVSPTWYTYLEQGRDVRPSAQVVESLSRALRLDEAERTHLYLLAHEQVPAPSAPAREELDPSTETLMAALEPQPAYVTSRCWDLLACNRAAADLFQGLTDLLEPDRNLVWWMFTAPGARHTLADWEDEAKRLLARFRAAAARYPNDESFARVRDRVLAASPEARAWWPGHDLLARTDGVKVFSGAHGRPARALRHIVLAPVGNPEQKVVVYLPLPPGWTPNGSPTGAAAADVGASA